MNKILFLIFIVISAIFNVHSQVVKMIPADATIDSTVTIYFDATEGDQGLMGYQGDVYAHTGVITMESTSGSDWKHVVADWGTTDSTVLMTKEGEDLYSLSFQIKTFYNMQPDETVLKLAFVFRNADGSETGRAADGSDIYVPLKNATEWNYKRHKLTSSALDIITSGGTIRFQAYPDHTIGTRFMKDTTHKQLSYGLTAQPINFTFETDTSDTYIHARLDDMRVSIRKNPLEITYLKTDTIIHLDDFLIADKGKGGLVSFTIDPDTRFYGGGSRALPYDLHGYKLEFYNQAHYGYDHMTANLNISIPLLTTSKNYSLLFDNHYPSSADIGATDNTKLTYQMEGGEVRFLLTSHDSSSHHSGTLAKLTGYAPLPPLWGLGYIQSRYGYENQTEAEQVVNEMRSQGFPMDALVLDLYWFGGTNRMGDFSWDFTRFPEPQNMMQSFKEKGVETILITEPYFTLESDLFDEAASLGHFAENTNGEPYVLYGFWAGDASLFDMSSDSAKEWLWPYYKNLLDMGVSGLWTDLGEPESHPDDMLHTMGSTAQVHNLFNNFWSELLYEKTATHYPDKRLFNLTRSGYTGMQRFGTYPWSGDVQRSFSGLRAQIPIMLHMGMSGAGYMHSDIGGFTGGSQDPELYTRWMQLGAFSPVMRAHGVNVPPEPIYYAEETRQRVKKIIEMRYEFLPYNYTLAWEYSTKGTPLARPMNYYPTEYEPLQTSSDQYLWGKDLLVAPVLYAGETQRPVSFPEGEWFDYYTGRQITGKSTYTANATLDEIPLFIRQGGFIVQSSEKLLHTKAYDSDSVRIRHVIPEVGETSSGYWYHDDGITKDNIKNNQYNIIKMSSSHSESITTITLNKSTNHIPGPERYIEFMTYGVDGLPGDIQINDTQIPLYTTKAFYDETSHAAYWDGNFLFVHFPWKDTLAQVKINHQQANAIAEQQHKPLHIHLQPNPFIKQAIIVTTIEKPGYYQLSLYSTGGQKISTGTYNLEAGRHRIALGDLTNKLNQMKPGVYILKLHGEGKQAQIKVVKMKN